MLHILHVIESLEFGGAEKVVVHLANKLASSYKVSICVTKRKGDLITQVNSDIKIHFLDTGEGNSLALPVKLKKLILSEKVDIVQCHNWGIYLESTLATVLSGRAKLIHTVHGHYTLFEPGFKSKVKIKIRHLLEKLASSYTFMTVPVSNSIKQYIIDDINISANSIQTIHNGIDGLVTNEFRVKDYSKYIKLIIIGRLAKIKNHSLLLHAFKRSLDSNSKLRLTVVGDGPELSNLKSLTESLGLIDYVEFYGFRTDIEELLLSHDIFLLSSDYEGISIAILEAMSLKMPVIATDVGGNPEVVINNKTGIIVAKNNSDEFSDAINVLTGTTNLIELYGEEGYHYFYNNFHESVVLKQYTKLYESTAG
ncbi:MAG: glycosyltransferase [Methylococcales bacterium]